MAIALEYKPLIAWRTFAMNVRLLEKETDENPAEYRLRVSPVDRHDLGAGTVDNECYFISFMGNPYTVTNTGENFIDVRDDFRVGTAPTAAKIGIVYKSIDKAPFIAPTFYRYLHKTALDNMRKIELSIVWQYATLLNNSWTPKGIIFEYDQETGFLSHTAGQLNVANWYAQMPEKRLEPGTEIDTTPVHKAFTVAANSFEITEPDAFFIYALFPIDKNVSTVQFHVSKQYWREKMFDGFIIVLCGILNSEDEDRELALIWGNKKTHPPVTIATPANGLSIDSNQVISMAIADATKIGALSAADWQTFNNKQTQLNGTGLVRMDGTTINYDANNYALVSQLHDPVTRTNSATVTITLSGQNITADVVQSGLSLANLGEKNFASLAAKPTTLAGYGITDAYTKTESDGRYKPIAYVPAWSEITSNPFSFTSPANGQLIKYNSTSGKWENWTPNYLTSFTETDPVYTASSWYSTTNNSSNWNAAYTARIASLTTTGSSGAATLISNVLNIPNYTLAGLGGQPQLDGTGFVKISGTTISYDNSTYEPAFAHNTAFNKNFGTTAGTVLEGRTFGTAANSAVGDFIQNQNSVYQNASGKINGEFTVGDFYSTIDQVYKVRLVGISGGYNYLQSLGTANASYPLAISSYSGTNLPEFKVFADASNFTGTIQATTGKFTTGAANGYIFVSDANGLGSWKTINNTIGGNALTTGYLPYWDGNKLANSGLIDNGTGFTYFRPATMTNTTKIVLANSYYQAGIQSTNGSLELISEANNIGLSITNKVVNIPNLSGTGTRPILSQSDGTLIANDPLSTGYLPYWDGNKLANTKLALDGSTIRFNGVSGNVPFESIIGSEQWKFGQNSGGNGTDSNFGFYNSVYGPSHGYASVLTLYNDGSARFNNLGGTGTRLTTASSDGTLGTQANGIGFLKNNGSGVWSYDNSTYLTSFTETDPVFNAHTVHNIVNGTGFLKNNGSGTWTYDNSTYLTGITKAMIEAQLTGNITSHTHAYDNYGYWSMYVNDSFRNNIGSQYQVAFNHGEGLSTAYTNVGGVSKVTYAMDIMSLSTIVNPTTAYYVAVNGGSGHTKITLATLQALIGGGGSGSVTSVAAGAGMDFTTITATGTVTMGTPSTLTAATTNSASGTTHTHQITGFLPLTGGTLTGALAGTSASFSSTVTASNHILSGSDLRLKTNIHDLVDLSRFDQINWKSFEMLSDRGRMRYGVIAQQVEAIVPELVIDQNGMKHVSYIDLLVAKVARLEQRVKELEGCK